MLFWSCAACPPEHIARHRQQGRCRVARHPHSPSQLPPLHHHRLRRPRLRPDSQSHPSCVSCLPGPGPGPPHSASFTTERHALILPRSLSQLTAANPALTAAELAHILNLSKPAAIITTTAGLATIQAAAALRAPEARAAVDYARSGNVFTVDLDVDAYGASAGSLNRPGEVQVDGWRVRDWQTLIAAKPVEFTPPKYEGTEAGLRTAVIFWSSGTSGKSKGVMMSHKALGSALVGCWHGSGLKPGQEVTVGLPPMYHIFGWAMILQPGPAFGNTSTLISKFDPQSYLRLVQATRATHLHIAPPVAVLLAKSPLVDGFDLSSVRACTSGGAPLGASVIKAVYERHKIPVWMGYGLSETAG